MVAVSTIVKRRHTVDLCGHHALCEMNFHQLVSLLPGLRDGVDRWAFCAGASDSLFHIAMHVVDMAPYTTTIEVKQDHAAIPTPRIVIRLYHDVNMAEIVSWDNHRHWLPKYSYPNPQMYHPDEKAALNQFLGDWLSFCRQEGLHATKTVMQFS